MPESLKLKPCPFCGGEARFEEITPEKFPHTTWTVHCNNSDADCFAAIADFATYDRKTAAAEAWNMRRPPQSPPLEIEGEVNPQPALLEEAKDRRRS